MRRLLYVPLVPLLCILTGCVTPPPPRYYTLDMRPSGNAKTDVSLDVRRLRESEALARKDILIKKSPTEIEYYASDQWAAALGELVSQKLQAEFGARSGTEDTLAVTGTILNFGQADVPEGALACATLLLEFREPDESLYKEPVFKKTYERKLQAPGTEPGAIVKTLSRALEQNAAEAAADVDALK